MLSQLHGSAFLDLEETKRIEIYQQVYPRKGRFLYDISGENYTLYNWLLILSLASSEPFARWSSPTQWAQAHKPSFRGNSDKTPSLCFPSAELHKQMLIFHCGQKKKINIPSSSKWSVGGLVWVQGSQVMVKGYIQPQVLTQIHPTKIN